MRRSIVVRRLGTASAIVLAAVALAAGGASPASAQTGLSITTTFPAVTVQPGATVSFDVVVAASEPSRVDLTMDGLPDGWSASLSGGGNEVQGVFVDSGAPATVTVAIDVPDTASGGSTPITVVGTAGSASARLELDLTVAEAGGGSVSIESDFPSLRGAVDTDFKFNLTLHNDTPQQLTFALQADGPTGWTVDVKPTGETQAASVTVNARGTQRLEVTATANAQAAADTYPITVQAVAGDQRATSDLAVVVTGSVKMDLTTPDERLNTTANAGATQDFDVVVVNSGTSPLSAVALAGTGPSDWEITFDPETIEAIPAGESVTATAHITPSTNAVAGDYQLHLTSRTEEANESLDVRVTVETAPVWGLVGLALVALTLGGMVWVFRRYGRR